MRPAGVALLALAVALGACGDSGGESGAESAAGALATEQGARASGIQLSPGERLLWGNLVVRAVRDDSVELRDVRLLDASRGLRIRRLMVADEKRPQQRLLVFGEDAFRSLPEFPRWQESLHPLRGYRVEPAAPGRMTEIVVEFEPIGRGSAQVRGGVRVHYRVGEDDARLRIPNQLTACAPAPCELVPPAGL